MVKEAGSVLGDLTAALEERVKIPPENLTEKDANLKRIDRIITREAIPGVDNPFDMDRVLGLDEKRVDTDKKG
ncbi:MAG: hypothetical protein ACD_52C00237G0002 [uncultured bacterium]|nr:MAG: hypothetical protein ACD_52C00237G0002 [uncultured bacterium]